jgi:hypothetical protein
MRRSLVATIVFTGIGWAQQGGTGAAKAPAEGTHPPAKESLVLHKLESITWNPETAELSWVVSVWDGDSSSGQPKAKESYTIHADTAIMNFHGEGRRFDSDEARQVRIVMDMITKYTIESTVWWAHGLGEKLDSNQPAPGAPTPAPGTKDGKGRDEEKTKPGNKAAPALMHTPVAASPSFTKEARQWMAGSHHSQPGINGSWY